VRTLGPGLVVATAGVLVAMALHELVDALGILTWAIFLGAAATNVGLLPVCASAGLRFTAKRLLRLGIVLLGFSLSLGSIVALGPAVVGMIASTLAATLVATVWLGGRLGLGRPRSLLIATGFAICGASAIAAMQENAEADEDDVATAVAMVTICGSAAMICLPLLQGPLALSDAQVGVWAGASVHEVGQVIAAASPAGAAAVALAAVVKLTRVVLLAPVVVAIGAVRRTRTGPNDGGRRPPLMPAFVVAFLVCVAVRSSGWIPDRVLEPIETVQTFALAAAMFALGAGVHVPSLMKSGGRALVLGVVSTLVVGGVSLPWVLWLIG
jgi:uncharacterized integral membrane protein (TIGR00698 family)